MSELWASFPWGIQAFIVAMAVMFIAIIAALPHLTRGGSLKD